LFRLYDRIEATGEPVPTAELATAYHTHALLAGADGGYQEELRFSQQAEDSAWLSGDAGLISRVRAGRGAALADLDRVLEAERTCRSVLAWSRSHGVADEALPAVCALAWLLLRRGALDEAADLLAAARSAEAVRPSERARRAVDMMLGVVALARGDVVAAHDHLVVALRSQMRFGFHSWACQALNLMAVRCALGGDPETAARLFGAAQAVRAQLHLLPGNFATFWIEHLDQVRATLGDVDFDRAYADGGTLCLAEATAAALAVEHPDLVAGSTRF